MINIQKVVIPAQQKQREALKKNILSDPGFFEHSGMRQEILLFIDCDIY